MIFWKANFFDRESSNDVSLGHPVQPPVPHIWQTVRRAHGTVFEPSVMTQCWTLLTTKSMWISVNIDNTTPDYRSLHYILNRLQSWTVDNYFQLRQDIGNSFQYLYHTIESTKRISVTLDLGMWGTPTPTRWNAWGHLELPSRRSTTSTPPSLSLNSCTPSHLGPRP